MAEKKKLDPWLPSDLASSLEYKQPNYSNLWGTPAGAKPTYHSQEDFNTAREPIAAETDAYNKKLYDDWNASYQAQRAARDTNDYANQKSIYDAGMSAAQLGNPVFRTNAAEYSMSYDNGTNVWNARNLHPTNFDDQQFDPYTFTYRPTEYGPDYTMQAAPNYTSTATMPLSASNTAAPSFGGRLTTTPNLNFGNSTTTAPTTSSVPQVQQLTPTAVNTSMPQQPSYIGAGMGTPNTSQTMGRGLSAVGVKAPGT